MKMRKLLGYVSVFALGVVVGALYEAWPVLFVLWVFGAI